MAGRISDSSRSATALARPDSHIAANKHAPVSSPPAALRKAAGAYGKGLAKDAKPWPTGAKVVVLAGKHTGERGTVEHSDSKITTVKFSDCKSDPVWTDSLSIYGG